MNKMAIMEVVKMIGSSKYVFLLVSVVFLDIVVGTAKGFITGKSSSSVGLRGLMKHALVLVVVITVLFYFLLFDLQVMGKPWILFFIVQYITSLVESWGEMGLPLPTFIKDRLQKLHDNTDGGMFNETTNKSK